MDLELTNKRVLVTGSSRGIGLGIAQGFAREGAKVTFCGREKQNLQSLVPKSYDKNDHLWQTCDFTKASEIDALKTKIQNEWQGLDVLVCNVGNSKSTTDIVPKDDQFLAILDANLFSAAKTLRTFIPMLEANPNGGSVVFIASIAGREVFSAAPTDYAVSKAALVAFAKNTAKKLAAKKIRVNCVAPGNIYFSGGRWEELQKENPDQVEKMLKEKVPLQRFGVPEEIANLVVFLSSEKASFITGSVVDVDGGQRVGF